MTNRNIYAMGETVYDLIFKNGKVVTGNPGGSVLNTVVSLGRLGLKPFFVSDFSNDKVGIMIKKFLESNGVETKSVYADDNKRTSVAFAFLDDNNNAEYEFYKERPSVVKNDLFDVEFLPNDIFMFGSYYALIPEIRQGLLNTLNKAKNNNAITIYDVNFRPAHSAQLEELRPIIINNIHMSDIVRGSDEDFNLVFGTSDYNSTIEKLKTINDNFILIYTMGAKGCIFYQKNKIKVYEVPKIETVSTVGAGDNFNAGVIYGIIKSNFTRENIIDFATDENIKNMINYGIKFSQEVCQSNENYIAQPQN